MNIYFNLKSKVKSVFKEGIEMGRIVSDGVYLARDLVNEPALVVGPDYLVNVARDIAKKSGGKITVKVLDREECQKLGMNAYLSVAQGSHRAPKFIVMQYNPLSSRRDVGTSAGQRKKICLIGKSITFDTGGLSLKSGKGMETMKLDMAGGATVLGVFRILANISNPLEIFGILPACENMPGGGASRPGDIVRALNGKTIEIINTDAEGRLVLADALSYAEKYLKPNYIIDIATLTGSIMSALGNQIAGVFTTDNFLKDTITKAAKQSGEFLWLMPFHKPYEKNIKSDIADWRNMSSSSYGGSITATLFLSNFIKKTPWMHLDIAGVSFNESSPYGVFSKGGTGWGVRTILDLVQRLASSV